MRLTENDQQTEKQNKEIPRLGQFSIYLCTRPLFSSSSQLLHGTFVVSYLQWHQSVQGSSWTALQFLLSSCPAVLVLLLGDPLLKIPEEEKTKLFHTLHNAHLRKSASPQQQEISFTNSVFSSIIGTTILIKILLYLINSWHGKCKIC